MPYHDVGEELRLYSDSYEAYLAVRYTAQSAISRGLVVCVDQPSGPIKPVPASGNEADMPIGVAVENIAQGEKGWVAVCGRVYVQPNEEVSPVAGYIIYCSSSVAGVVEQAANVGFANHWREVGHWVEDNEESGALTLAQIHFN